MKKMAVLLCCVFLVLSLCACKNDSAKETNNYNVGSNSLTISMEHDVGEDQVAESLYEKLIREIDGAYAEESKLPESSTTVGMVELADKYAKKWQQVADEYYNKIMEFDENIAPSEIYYSTDDLHTFVSNLKTNWEAYYQVQCENYLKTLQAIYNGGTIVGPIFADYKYEMQKEWALQLVGICQQMYIE